MTMPEDMGEFLKPGTGEEYKYNPGSLKPDTGETNAKITPEERTARAVETMVNKGELRRIKPPENLSSEDAWVKLVFGSIEKAESVSDRNNQKSKEGEVEKEWLAIQRLIEEVPDSLGTRNALLSKYLKKEYPNGVYLKERLEIYLVARRNLMDRYLEIKLSGGSLNAMGVGREKVPYAGIAYPLTEVRGIDAWTIINAEDIFRDSFSSRSEAREVLANVDAGLSEWFVVGQRYNTLPENLLRPDEKKVLDKIFARKSDLEELYREEDKGKRRQRKLDKDTYWPSPEDVAKVMEVGKDIAISEIETYMSIPTFKNSLNSTEQTLDLRSRIVKNVGKNSEETAYKLFSVWLSLSLWDRERSGVQGRSEDRDIMWSDEKRGFDFGKKEREPGVDWTIRRYFAKPDQEFLIDKEDADKSKKFAYRREMLAINFERAVFVKPEDYSQGEFVGDFLNTVVFIPDELKPGKFIARKIVSYVNTADGSKPLPNAWKEIPFLESLGERSYSGYFGYNIGIASALIELTGSTTWKEVAELKDPSFWENRRQLFDRLDIICPWLNAAEDEYRGYIVRDLLKANGISDSDVAKITGYAGTSDLDVIRNAGNRKVAESIINKNINKVLEAKNRADDYKEYGLDKMRFVDALGVVWPGTWTALQEVGGIFAQSKIQVKDYLDILKALKVSRYLSDEAFDRFRYEAYNEMGFGSRLDVKPQPRYRIR